MKSLILGDCDCLIKFILFGDEGNINNKDVSSEKKEERHIIKHIPRNILWPGETFVKDDDLDFYINDVEVIKPKNDMGLAIYHCSKGNFSLPVRLVQVSNIFII